MVSKDIIEECAKKQHIKKGFFNKDEFKKDFRNLFTIKKMINRFLEVGSINEKLLVNNIVIALNTFGIVKTNILLKMVLEEEQWSVGKTILIFLSSFCLHDDVTELNYTMKNILIEDESLMLFRKEERYQ